MYTAQRPSRCEHIPLRTLRYHVRCWGPACAASALPPLVLAHGWMDVAASYQFVVDALSESFVQGRSIIAPDWRGFGHSQPGTPVDHYHFVEYLADLEALLDHYAPGQAIDLVGHSMGGNVAMLYAGARPARIRRLVNLEGFGLAAAQASDAPGRYAQWLDDTRALASGAMALQSYDSLQGVAQRLRKTNPRLDLDKARWLAQHWAAPQADGRWHILGDAAHKVVNPHLFRVDEVLALYAAITAPTLAVEASDDSLGKWSQGRLHARRFPCPADPCARLPHRPSRRCRPYAAPRSAPGRGPVDRKFFGLIAAAPCGARHVSNFRGHGTSSQRQPLNCEEPLYHPARR